MAVYTDVPEDDLRVFLQRYDIGEARAFKGIAEGVENSNFLLRTEQGSFILTLYEKRVAAADLPFFIALMEHLAKAGFACPRPIRRRDGEALGTLAGRPCAIVTFLDGMGLQWPGPEECRKAGAGLATLHEKARGLPHTRANALDMNGWKPLLDKTARQADSVETGLQTLIESQFAALQEEWPRDLPHGVIHGDFFKDNVFFLNGEFSGVIDFYFACNDLLAYDIAIAINAWCFDRKFNFDAKLSQAFIEGYTSVRALSEAEIAALPILCRGAALRFLLTRLNDWLDVPEDALVTPHDPRDFSARLRFHAAQMGPGIYLGRGGA